MTPLFIDGVAMWAPAWPGWATARAAFRGEVGDAFEGEGTPADPPLRRPSPGFLPAAERRRAPDSVALALEVAAQAVAQSGHCAADLISVFTSAHGDLTLTDSLCSTLVDTPTLVSPTKFLNSVHNAAAGYWAQATGCRQASVAVSAFRHSFAAGLLEACVQCATDDRAVLLVACDIEACGALAFTTENRGLLGFALVLSPVPGARSMAALTWSLASGPSTPCALRSAAAQGAGRQRDGRWPAAVRSAGARTAGGVAPAAFGHARTRPAAAPAWRELWHAVTGSRRAPAARQHAERPVILPP